MTDFYNRYKNLFFDPNREPIYESYLMRQSSNNNINYIRKNKTRQKTMNEIDNFKSRLNPITNPQINKSNLEKSRLLKEFQDEIVPKFSSKREKIYTQPTYIQYNKRFNYQLPPIKPIDWNKDDFRFHSRQKSFNNPFHNIPYRKDDFSVDKLNYFPKQQINQNIFRKTLKKAKHIRFQQVVDNNQTIKKREKLIQTDQQKYINLNDVRNYEETARQSRKSKSPFRFLEFEEQKVNDFQFLDKKIQDIRKIQKFNYRTKINEYREALERRKAQKLRSQRKTKIRAMFAQEQSLIKYYF